MWKAIHKESRLKTILRWWCWGHSGGLSNTCFSFSWKDLIFKIWTFHLPCVAHMLSGKWTSCWALWLRYNLISVISSPAQRDWFRDGHGTHWGHWEMRRICGVSFLDLPRMLLPLWVITCRCEGWSCCSHLIAMREIYLGVKMTQRGTEWEGQLTAAARTPTGWMNHAWSPAHLSIFVVT